MSRVETNDAKRLVMRQLVVALQRDLGWTTAQLATWMWVTPGTIARWRSGDSMGTNVQRATLAKLKSPAEERPRILEIAAQLEQEATKSEVDVARDEAAGAYSVAKYRRSRIARIRLRVGQLRNLFCASTSPDDHQGDTCPVHEK